MDFTAITPAIDPLQLRIGEIESKHFPYFEASRPRPAASRRRRVATNPRPARHHRPARPLP